MERFMIELIPPFSEFPLSPTLGMNEKAKQKRAAGETIYHMGFGEAPFPVHKILADTLAENVTHKEYLPSGGLPALQEKVLSYYQKKIGITPEDYDVIIAPGSKLILYAVQMSIKGDLLMPVPSWVSYEPQSQMLNRNTIKFDVDLSEDSYKIHPETLERAIINAKQEGKNPSKLILNTPNNPTGSACSRDNLEEIAAICKKHDILILSDEIYGLTHYTNEHTSISSFAPDITVVTSGLSKHLSLGGWRLGIGLVPKSIKGLFDMLCNISSETWSCVPAPIQYAAIKAYENNPEIEQYIEDCTKIHALINGWISNKLIELGITCTHAKGAFYNYPDFEAFKEALAQSGITTSEKLCNILIEKYNIACLPGIAFGEIPTKLTMRLSGCDYNGGEVLKAWKSNKDMDENEFIVTYAPNIKGAVNQFKKFLSEL